MSDGKYLSGELILRKSFDAVTNSLNVQIPEIAVELSAADGDSVITERLTVQVAVTAGQVINVSKYSQICYLHASNPNSGVKALLLDNVTEITLPNLVTGVPASICCLNIKIALAGELVLKS